MQKLIAHYRTIKIDITPLLNETDKVSIRSTINDCTKAFGLFVNLGNIRKSTSYQTLHKHGYADAKQLVPNLPTAILQQTAKVALSNIKSWNTKVKDINTQRKHKNQLAIKKGWKNYKPLPMTNKWEYQGQRNTQSYPVNLLSMSRRGDLTTFSSNNHRIRLRHKLPEWFTKRYPDAKLQAGNVCIIGKRFFLHLTFKVQQTQSIPGQEVVGIDRGINNLVATSKNQIKSSKHILGVKQRYQTIKQQLQQKGTRSAKRHLKRLSGRERRFMLDVNHCITKQLASDKNVGVYVLENLTGIRNQSKGKRFNRLLSNWAFCQFEFLLTYKCAVNGILVEHVNPQYTSQKCSVCKKVHEKSRNGETYRCVFCGHTEHADINAAINIRDNYLTQRVAFNQPIVTT